MTRSLSDIVKSIRLAEYDHKPDVLVDVRMEDLSTLKDFVILAQSSIDNLTKRLSVAEAINTVSKMERPKKKRLDEYV